MPQTLKQTQRQLQISVCNIVVTDTTFTRYNRLYNRVVQPVVQPVVGIVTIMYNKHPAGCTTC